MADRHLLFAAGAALLVLAAAPASAVRPHRVSIAPPPPPIATVTTVTVHRGESPVAVTRGAGWRGAGGFAAPLAYREPNYGREDDAAIFAARYGCARPIWNSASNRYIAPCN